MPEEQLVLEILAAVRRERYFIQWLAEDFQAKLFPAVGEQQPADAAPHAMPDNDHRLARRKPLFHFIELVAEDGGGIGIRVSARIAVEPELIVLPDHRVAPKFVDHRRPRRLRIHEAVDDQDDGLVWIVRLESLD